MAADTRHGPFTTRQWVLGAGGGVASYLLYRWWKGRTAASSAAAQTALAGGTTIPDSSVTTRPVPTNISQWLQAALAYGSDPTATFNAATNWLNGNCVDAGGFGGLQSAIAQLGLPPTTNLPVLTVCATPTPGGPGGGGGPPPANNPPPAVGGGNDANGQNASQQGLQISSQLLGGNVHPTKIVTPGPGVGPYGPGFDNAGNALPGVTPAGGTWVWQIGPAHPSGAWILMS